MTLRAAMTIVVVLMGLTVIGLQLFPELLYRPPPPTDRAAPVAAPLEDLPAGISEAVPVADATAPVMLPAGANPTPDTAAGVPVPPEQVTAQELKTGDGAAVAAGQTAVVHYTGWLWDAGAPDNKGRKFDSSRDHGDTFAFRVGGGEVIRGWDLGVEGMKVGGQRRLVIPPEFGYGERGAGGVIPGGATLVFDVELMGIR